MHQIRSYYMKIIRLRKVLDAHVNTRLRLVLHDLP